MSVIAEQNKQFILFVATRRILILFNCHTSDNFFVDNAGSPDERGAVGHILPLLFLKILCQFVMLEICVCAFSKASETNLVPALLEFSRGSCISYLDFLINAHHSLFTQ